jgi:hypothetical protein
MNQYSFVAALVTRSDLAESAGGSALLANSMILMCFIILRLSAGKIGCGKNITQPS